MLEVNTYKKNKINLEDYDFKRDIENRLIMSKLNDVDIRVLEEILYNTLKIPVDRLISDLEDDLPKDAIKQSI